MNYLIRTIILTALVVLATLLGDQVFAEDSSTWVCYSDDIEFSRCVDEPNYYCNEQGCVSIEDKLRNPVWYSKRIEGFKRADKALSERRKAILYRVLSVILTILIIAFIAACMPTKKGSS